MTSHDFNATLRNLNGDLGLFATVSNIFLEDAPVIIEELESSIRQSNAQGAADALHKLKGLVGNFHAHELMQQISENENRAKIDAQCLSAEEAKQIVNQVNQLAIELREYLAAENSI